jgi:hypothetical protein
MFSNEKVLFLWVLVWHVFNTKYRLVWNLLIYNLYDFSQDDNSDDWNMMEHC